MYVFPETIELPDALRDRLTAQWRDITTLAANAAVMDETLAASLAHVMASSAFVTDFLLHQPAWLAEFITSGRLQTQYLPQEMAQQVRTGLAGVLDRADLMPRLRGIRAREMARIAWRDLLAWSDVATTLVELSALADACLSETVSILQQALAAQFGVPRCAAGAPQAFVVIGMGKLGAQELNFSSDIDLIFAYPQAGCTDGAQSIDNADFFTRLAQQLIQVLDTHTEQGFVFRVDVRLRPYGDSGPLVLGFAAMESYYQGVARQWERYAMVKARVIVGDNAARAQFDAIIQPFVYRRYLDFNAIASLREMKAMIVAQTLRQGMSQSIKLGPGGIREVEFIGQVFQLIRGGREPSLQQRAIVRVLQALQQCNVLSADTVQGLIHAYWFLRRTENHMQMLADQQTHQLPTDAVSLWRLAHAMGFADVAAFLAVLNQHRDRVRQQFQAIFADQSAHEENIWRSLWVADSAPAHADWGGFQLDALRQKIAAFRATRAYRTISGNGRMRLDQLLPKLLAQLAGEPQAMQLLPRFLRFLEQIAGRVSYLALIAEYDAVRVHLVKLGAASAWIMELLTRFPLLLDELLDSRRLYHPPDMDGLNNEIKIMLEKVVADDLEQQMEIVRQFVHANKLRIAAADITRALPLMVVSDQLSMVAEVTLNVVKCLCWRSLAARFGEPMCRMDGRTQAAQFGIVAYGKLGGLELSYRSDLDVVFVFDGSGVQKTNGPERVDNQWFFIRLAQKMLHFLQVTLASGAAYEIDTRLRPNGASGSLVAHVQNFGDYQRLQAWTWEHQALVRARMVVGDAALQGKFDQIRGDVLRQNRAWRPLCTDVSSMRNSMRQQLGNKDPEKFHLKQDVGGIADIEFMVQYCVLRYASEYPELMRYTDNIRLLEIIPKTGILTVAQAQRMADVFRAYRSVVHAHALNDQSVLVCAQTFAQMRGDVMALWRQLFSGESVTEG